MRRELAELSPAGRGPSRWFSLALALALLVSISAWAVDSTGVHRYFTHRVGGPDRFWDPDPRDSGYPPLLRVAAVGDFGTGSPAAYRTARAIASAAREAPFDVLVLLGDNVYPKGDPDRLSQTILEPFAPLLNDQTRLLPVLGNHDVQAGFGKEQLAALGAPAGWYATRFGDLLVVALDSNRPDEPAQLGWLERTLRTSDARWILAVMHHPPYSAGWHGSDGAVREAFVPLFERHCVQLVLAAHDHDYQRSRPIAGVTYVVSGGGAKTRPTGRAEFTREAWSVLHYVEIDVWPDRLEFRAVSQDGLLFDEATIEEARPSSDASISCGQP